jgi:metal-responsive CopG/Arc/MetJ family transcriptional regulator
MKNMRTTVELKVEHRIALHELAARRGQKGLSALVSEAIEEYLRGEQDRERRRAELLSLAGSLCLEDADDLRRTTGALRESWR